MCKRLLLPFLSHKVKKVSSILVCSHCTFENSGSGQTEIIFNSHTFTIQNIEGLFFGVWVFVFCFFFAPTIRLVLGYKVFYFSLVISFIYVLSEEFSKEVDRLFTSFLSF